MDTFFEQLIKIKKTTKTYLGYLLITLLTIILITIGFLFIPSLSIVIGVLVCFGAFKLYSMLNIEYEYIITNSSFDIDKIIAKSSRKRILSFDLSNVQKIESYIRDLHVDITKDVLFACNGNEDNVVILTIQTEGKSKQSIIIAPDDRMCNAMKKFLPKHVGDNL